MTREHLHGDTGWLGRALAATVATGVIATARPEDAWVWVVLGLGMATFLTGTFLMNVRPYLALGLLTYAALSSALIVGVPDSNASVISLMAIADIAVMVLPQGNKPVIAVGIGCAAAFGLSALWWDRSESWYFMQLLWTAVLIAFGLNRRQYELTRHEQARAAALDERGRIARDLHDVLAHSLGALSVQLEVAEALLEERNDTAGALERVRRSRRLAVQGLIEARNAVAALRSSEVPALPEALAVLAEQHGQDHRASVAVRTEGKPRPLESGVIVALLGAAREALNNAGKHAPGRPIDVRLDYREGVRLSVRNPGTTERGADGFGLTGMRERLALVDGKLEAGPDGDDWLVVAEVADV